MKTAQIVAATFSAGVLVALQGCGGSGDNPSPSPDPGTTTLPGPATTASTTSTTTTTTTTTTLPRSPPLTGDEAAAYLNELYTGYSESNETTLPGVVMRTASAWGFFCDGFEDYMGCYMGFAHCITSASILNDKVMLRNKKYIEMGLRRTTGIMFNSSLVEEKLGRCTYMYDGTSWGRYNRGCGTTAEGATKHCPNATDSACFCKEGEPSAWWNLDPATGEEYAVDSELVDNDYCGTREWAGTAPTNSNSPPCFWKGAAYDSKNGFVPSESRTMIERRLTAQGKGGEWDKWNEVVLDAELLLQELRRDPARVVVAIVYLEGTGSDAGAQGRAQTIADAMKAEFNMAEAVPVVGVMASLDTGNQPDVPGPFFHTTQWTTGTTTTTPRTTAACCHNLACDKDCQMGYCVQSQENCETGCAGTWCPPSSGPFDGPFNEPFDELFEV